MDDLGPATERLLAAAFAETAILTAKAAARLIGVDEKTPRFMAEAGLISSVTVGTSTRRYTEANIRAYLGHGEGWTPKVKPRRSGTVNVSKVTRGAKSGLFSERKRRAGKPGQ